MSWTPHTEVFCDDDWCKIVIYEVDHMRGCFYIIVDDDREHSLNDSAVGIEEARGAAEQAREWFMEDSGQFGVGS